MGWAHIFSGHFIRLNKKVDFKIVSFDTFSLSPFYHHVLLLPVRNPSGVLQHWGGKRNGRYNPTWLENPLTSRRRRQKPRGILLRVSAKCSQVQRSIWVSEGRINRQKDAFRQLLFGDNCNVRRIACSHQDIHYNPQYQGLPKEQVDELIILVLRAKERFPFIFPSSRVIKRSVEKRHESQEGLSQIKIDRSSRDSISTAFSA